MRNEELHVKMVIMVIPASKNEPRKPRVWIPLVALLIMATVITLWNVSATAHQVSLATGAPTEEQEQFFIQAVERPDLVDFFKSLTKPQQLAFARNIGQHDAPEMAGLCTRLLVVFDEEVRKVLTQSLTVLAARRPELVSKELKHSGSFQRVGVFTALQSLGDSALPHVSARLSEPETRANAAAYLVDAGKPAIPWLMTSLESPDTETRTAAAEALGSLRATSAVHRLTNFWDGAKGDEKKVFLASLSAIADDRSEPLFADILLDPKQTVANRSIAALGLGRIGSASAAKRLWNHLADSEEALAKSALAGLQLAGDAALSDLSLPLADRILVAQGVEGGRADSTLIEGLTSLERSLAIAAANGATGRPGLASNLAAVLRDLDAEADGNLASAIASSLVSTDRGRSLAAALPADSVAFAMTRRHLILAGHR